uniref:Uncharacterized protein n=1 Tax=Cacopsylla melanoneura TaxID=428564 RepID=A0A8D9A4S4_9HEMI
MSAMGIIYTLANRKDNFTTRPGRGYTSTSWVTIFLPKQETTTTRNNKQEQQSYVGASFPCWNLFRVCIIFIQHPDNVTYKPASLLCQIGYWVNQLEVVQKSS